MIGSSKHLTSHSSKTKLAPPSRPYAGPHSNRQSVLPYCHVLDHSKPLDCATTRDNSECCGHTPAHQSSTTSSSSNAHQNTRGTMQHHSKQCNCECCRPATRMSTIVSKPARKVRLTLEVFVTTTESLTSVGFPAGSSKGTETQLGMQMNSYRRWLWSKNWESRTANTTVLSRRV